MLFFLQPQSYLYGTAPSTKSTQVPAHCSCYFNLQIVGNINIQSVFGITSQTSSPITNNINSQSSSSVRISHFFQFQTMLLIIWFSRDIHFRLSTIHITPLSSIYVSIPIFILSHSDHSVMCKDMVCECTIHLKMLMIHSIHQPCLALEISQLSLAFR